jgi:type III pantothenate kinase
MIAAIDSGNSSVKLGIFKEGVLIKTFNSVANTDIPSILRSYPFKKIIISDVGGKKEELISMMPENARLIIMNHELNFEFTIKYKTPQTLGTDRLAGIAGAWNKYGPSNILVVDIGTCVTYDFIDHLGNYWGGGISPGIDLRIKSLHAFTSNLPLVIPQGRFKLFGNDTDSSIQSGTVGGIVAEINGMMECYREKYSSLKIVICGGSSGFFESKIKGPIFVFPGLVLWGLCIIAIHNEI